MRVTAGRTWIFLVLVLWAISATAQCDPAGRPTFAAGLKALSSKDLPAAAKAFGDLVKAQPNCAEARNNLAVVLVEQGHIAAAAEQLRLALQARPDYKRARVNLDRVDAMLKSARAATPGVKPSVEVEAGTAVGAVSTSPTAAPTQMAPPSPTATHLLPSPTVVTAKPTPMPQPAQAQIPSGIAALEPTGTTSCIILPGEKRLCVYRRQATKIVADGCYPIAAVHVPHWPHWLAASSLSKLRIQLVDETGAQRMTVIPVGRKASGATIGLGAADFTALSTKVTLWRTAWIVEPAQAIPLTTVTAAAQALRNALEEWRKAWAGEQLDDYVGMYASGFVPESGHSRAHWEARKRYLFKHSGPIAVDITAPSIFVTDGGQTAITTFLQTYHSNIFASRAFKVLRWQREGQRWQITAETVLGKEVQSTN